MILPVTDKGKFVLLIDSNTIAYRTPLHSYVCNMDLAISTLQCTEVFFVWTDLTICRSHPRDCSSAGVKRVC